MGSCDWKFLFSFSSIGAVWKRFEGREWLSLATACEISAKFWSNCAIIKLSGASLEVATFLFSFLQGQVMCWWEKSVKRVFIYTQRRRKSCDRRRHRESKKNTWVNKVIDWSACGSLFLLSNAKWNGFVSLFYTSMESRCTWHWQKYRYILYYWHYFGVAVQQQWMFWLHC